MIKIGVLALQGCIDPHFRHLSSCGVNARKVRSPGDLSGCDGLILPGGESSAMLRLIGRNGLTEPLSIFLKQKPAWGICAGAILLAERVINPEQFSFNCARVQATRNYYGSQLDSFKSEVILNIPESTGDVEHNMILDFIRAPFLTPLDASVLILGSHNGTPVILKDRQVLLSSCHPELGNDPFLHRYFVEIVDEAR